VAAQTAAAEQVVGKVEGGGDCFVDRNFRKGTKGGLGAEGCPYSVDLCGCGEMQGSGSLGYLAGMACAAGFLHLVWMGGLDDEPGMGLLLRCALLVASVAGGAGEIVGGVEPDVRVAACASGRAGRSFLNNGLFRSLALLAAGKGLGKQAEKHQDGAGFYMEMKRHRGTCILELYEFPAILPYLSQRQQAANASGKEDHERLALRISRRIFETLTP
jgi:hypothetical protein